MDYPSGSDTDIMSLLIFLMAALADTSLTGDARALVPDRISVEIALGRAGIEAEEASWLGGETWWRSDEDGQTTQRHRLGWSLLSGHRVLQTEDFGDGEGCAVLEGRDPVPGSRQVVLYSSTVTENVNMDAAVGMQPGMVLASTEDSEIALVALRPGDQVLVVDVENHRSGRRAELVELRRGNRQLQLKRDGQNPEACYGTMPVRSVR